MQVWKCLLLWVAVASPTCFGYAVPAHDGEDRVDLQGTRVTSTLKFVVAVSRHGNRGPLYPLNNFPYGSNNQTCWPFGSLGLSKVGRLEMYNIGAKLRKMYNGFISADFHDNDVFATSTSVDRVLVSGEAVLAGLYPPQGYQLWNENITWQPVPLHMDSMDKTSFTMGCQRFTEEQATVKSSFGTKYNTTISYVNNYVNEQIKAGVSGTFGVISVWDTLYTIDVEGFPLPDWTSKIYPTYMRDMMNEMYNVYVAQTDELVKLLIGQFYKNMIDVMSMKVNGTLSPDRKFYFYSGHDDTIITLQAILGISIEDMIGIVAPASTIVYEIHQNAKTKKFTMEVLYINGTEIDQKPKILKTPNCGSPCDFDLLVKNTEKYFLTDYNSECRTSSVKLS